MKINFIFYSVSLHCAAILKKKWENYSTKKCYWCPTSAPLNGVHRGLYVHSSWNTSWSQCLQVCRQDQNISWCWLSYWTFGWLFTEICQKMGRKICEALWRLENIFPLCIVVTLSESKVRDSVSLCCLNWKSIYACPLLNSDNWNSLYPLQDCCLLLPISGAHRGYTVDWNFPIICFASSFSFQCLENWASDLSLPHNN